MKLANSIKEWQLLDENKQKKDAISKLIGSLERILCQSYLYYFNQPVVSFVLKQNEIRKNKDHHHPVSFAEYDNDSFHRKGLNKEPITENDIKAYTSQKDVNYKNKIEQFEIEYDRTKYFKESYIDDIIIFREINLKKLDTSTSAKDWYERCNNLLEIFFGKMARKYDGKENNSEELLDHCTLNCLSNKIHENMSYEDLKTNCIKNSIRLIQNCKNIVCVYTGKPIR